MVSGRRKRRTLRIGETPLSRQSLVHNLGVFASWREIFLGSRLGVKCFLAPWRAFSSQEAVKFTSRG
jgi:hypothetical protein